MKTRLLRTQAMDLRRTIKCMSNSVSLVIVAGLTGSGKSSALQQLERLGYTPIEALPPNLISLTVAQIETHYSQLAIGLDLRSPALLQDLDLLETFLDQSQALLLFLEATNEILVQRLTAHRRPHPFIGCPPQGGLLEAIQLEREWLDPVRHLSSRVIDTSTLSLSTLRQQIEQLIQPNPRYLTLTLLSFGFKYGVPIDANLMFDVRFLVNPYYHPDLRLLTGQDPQLQEYLFADPLTQRTYQQILSLLTQWIPAYLAEQRPHLTVAIGCTGGQHRSVTIVERLAADLDIKLDNQLKHPIQISHRHLLQSQAELAQRFGPQPEPGKGDETINI